MFNPCYIGHNSLVVMVSDRGWRVMSSSPVPLKTRRVGQRCTLNLTSLKCPPFGVKCKLGEGLPQLRFRLHHLTMVQNDKVRRQKPSSR
ncbi:hypothetical protein TNCV_2022781 [Trichonephila clavipes]|nr:hypothetical protein TNCV_2022781 [Trichonephila clavipes]